MNKIYGKELTNKRKLCAKKVTISMKEMSVKTDEATKAKINEKKREIVLAATCQTLSGLV